MSTTAENTADIQPWSQLVPDEAWAAYREVLSRAQQLGIPFGLGGGFAYSYYVKRWRDTKDIDLYILPETRDTMVDVLGQAGFYDYYVKLAYDRRWIYRGYRDGLITDLIWAMANQRTQVDLEWLTRGPRIQIRDITLNVIPVEELIWSKLYVLQRDRSDWPDVLAILYVQGEHLDWDRLLGRLDDDARLLGGVLNVLAWMCPDQTARMPAWVLDRVGVRLPTESCDCIRERRRVELLDSRDWFAPAARSEKLEVIGKKETP